MMATAEEMETFFNSVAERYEEHMCEFVDGAMGYYQKTADVIASFHPETLLDLGCGTGLELDEIFKRMPALKVVGVDLAQKLLDKLHQKHCKKDLTLINASYFDVDYGVQQFDCALSVMTLHHFDHPAKLKLYKKVHRALRTGGHYVETDYIILDPQEESFYASEKARLRKENNIAGFDCYDAPLTLDHQMQLLKEAGFVKVEEVWSQKNTRLLAAQKEDEG